MSGDRLSALDATFLELEQKDSSAHMHIGGVLVFDRVAGRPAPTVEDVALRLARRLDHVPRLYQRLSSPEVNGLRRPTWVDADPFDLEAHVRRAALPAPGGEAELLEWAGDFFSHRLDRRVPLWKVVLIDGLADGRWALALKLHHCMVDGMASLAVTRLLLDEEGPAPAGTAGMPSAVGLGLDALRHPQRSLARARALLELGLHDEIVAAPACSINGPIGEHRRLAAVQVPLSDVRAIKAALGGSVNDVVLSAVTGGLRALLLHRGETPPAAGLRAMVPVDVRPDDADGLGNRVSALFVALPVGEEDPRRRHAEVCRRVEAAKTSSQLPGAGALLELGEMLPPVLHAVAAQPVLGRRLFNLTVTNVRGPATAWHAFGAPMERLIPIVPLAAEHAVGIAVCSYAGELVFGVNCDRDRVPDAGVLCDGIETALADLRTAAPATPV